MDDKYSWISQGELSKICMPLENNRCSHELLETHIKRTGGKVIVRFPPEPNGFLHIGHAKAINLSNDFKLLHGGKLILRYDDTNPSTANSEFYTQILSDLKYLGIEPDCITRASDYFQNFIDYAFQLIDMELAYVCHLPKDSFKVLNDSGGESPFRTRSVELNRYLFHEMIRGSWTPGSAVLRMKHRSTFNDGQNDLVAFRIIHTPHPITLDKFKVYPSYDFSHCINDSIEDITHSFCSREFFIKREWYYWLLDSLGLYQPIQWEFSRLTLEGAVTSKRKIIQLKDSSDIVEFDDPRLFTLAGLRRRGIPGFVVNGFVKELGVTYNSGIIEMSRFETYVRDSLFNCAKLLKCIVSPLKLYLTHTNEEVYIEKSDFRPVSVSQTDSNVSKKHRYLRLAFDQPVGLYKKECVAYQSWNSDDTVSVVQCNMKPKKYIQWLDEKGSRRVSINFYDYLSGKRYEKSCIVDKVIEDMGGDELMQFMRIGYFGFDKNSTSENIILNMIVLLRDVNIDTLLA